MAYKTEQEELDYAVKDLSCGYGTLSLLDTTNHTTIQGVVYVSRTVYIRHSHLNESKFKTLCMQSGYPVAQADHEAIRFHVPITKVLEDCAAIAKAPKFEKIVGQTGDLDWKPRQPSRMTNEERAYIVTHTEEYNMGTTHGRCSTITPKAVAVGLRSKDSGKAARSALIASFNKNMYPWLILSLNLSPPNGRTWIGGAYQRVNGFDSDHGLEDLRRVAVQSRRETRAALKTYQEFEIMCRKISAFFRQHKGKTNLELKEIIVTKCLEKIFSNTPKYMDISPFNVVAKALSK